MCQKCKGPAIFHITLNLIKLKDLQNQITQLIQRILSFPDKKLGKDEDELYTKLYKIT